MLYFKESYDKQLDQAVEPQIPFKDDSNSNEIGSVAEKTINITNRQQTN